jgi:hypothetical protein
MSQWWQKCIRGHPLTPEVRGALRAAPRGSTPNFIESKNDAYKSCWVCFSGEKNPPSWRVDPPAWSQGHFLVIENTKCQISFNPSDRFWFLFHKKHPFLMQNQPPKAQTHTFFLCQILNILTECIIWLNCWHSESVKVLAVVGLNLTSGYSAW